MSRVRGATTTVVTELSGMRHREHHEHARNAEHGLKLRQRRTRARSAATSPTLRTGGVS